MNLYEMTKWAAEERIKIDNAVCVLNDNRRICENSGDDFLKSRLAAYEQGFITAFKVITGVEIHYDPLENWFYIDRG